MMDAGSPRRVLVVMGSDSDFPIMEACLAALEEFGIGVEVRVCSSHRTPEAALELARGAESRGIRVIIAGAGGAAHLAGMLAAWTSLPVIGVPIEAGALRGIDALYSTIQMPGGVPVAAMGIGKSGARNAGLFAVQVLALEDLVLAERIKEHRRRQAEGVAEKDARLQETLRQRSPGRA